MQNSQESFHGSTSIDQGRGRFGGIEGIVRETIAQQVADILSGNDDLN